MDLSAQGRASLRSVTDSAAPRQQTQANRDVDPNRLAQEAQQAAREASSPDRASEIRNKISSLQVIVGAAGPGLQEAINSEISSLARQIGLSIRTPAPPVERETLAPVPTPPIPGVANFNSDASLDTITTEVTRDPETGRIIVNAVTADGGNQVNISVQPARPQERRTEGLPDIAISGALGQPPAAADGQADVAPLPTQPGNRGTIPGLPPLPRGSTVNQLL